MEVYFYEKLIDSGRLLQFFHMEPGGAVYSNSITMFIINSYFSGNSAYDGGAVYFDKNPLVNNQILVIYKCIFKSNVAGDIGGGIAINYNVLTINGLIHKNYFKKNQAWCKK